ncbi:patatin-like phospholipase family protein [Alteromonas naphthalenivorans]|uniref:PNPLA domain-containing protein n=1 Tax=Alteromonas naphthalenivorans TaxID=715451 RepID=F5Z704_ALTNA|nr:patatin-like phospholipase family protein [Alteromonas naphthalenivorans]AEF05667.1 hypothetical protein ambt_20880 [Alteromonas naphthalenivorans]
MSTFNSRHVISIALVFLLSACAQTVHHQPLSKEQYSSIDSSQVGENIRWWGDTLPTGFEEGLRKEAEILKKVHPYYKEKAVSQNMLAISGGGANGAFGAGLLAGWTESGLRPTFDTVSGVSTGALIAPFAYLGTDYDDELLSIYSSIKRDDVYQPKILTGLLSGSALADTKSLQEQIEHYVTPSLVTKIAEIHRQEGRGLYIITTHLDAMRPMVWDIGEIAQQSTDDSVELIRSIMLASASIPVMFPPVPIERKLNGETYTELHVDGGVTRNVFAYPVQISLKYADKIRGLTFDRKFYLIQNGNSRLTYEPSQVGVLSIAERTIKGLLQGKGNADIERVYYLSQRDDYEFNTIEIPARFVANGAVDFDTVYMNELLELGRSIGKNGEFWYDKPAAYR